MKNINTLCSNFKKEFLYGIFYDEFFKLIFQNDHIDWLHSKKEFNLNNVFFFYDKYEHIQQIFDLQLTLFMNKVFTPEHYKSSPLTPTFLKNAIKKDFLDYLHKNTIKDFFINAELHNKCKYISKIFNRSFIESLRKDNSIKMIYFKDAQNNTLAYYTFYENQFKIQRCFDNRNIYNHFIGFFLGKNNIVLKKPSENNSFLDVQVLKFTKKIIVQNSYIESC